jgi:hypothetical protein
LIHVTAQCSSAAKREQSDQEDDRESEQQSKSFARVKAYRRGLVFHILLPPGRQPARKMTDGLAQGFFIRSETSCLFAEFMGLASAALPAA